jgi:hypothetical protein
MEFVETAVFTKALHTLLTDDEYRLLQNTWWRDPWWGTRCAAVAAFAKCDSRLTVVAKVAAFE